MLLRGMLDGTFRLHFGTKTKPYKGNIFVFRGFLPRLHYRFNVFRYHIAQTSRAIGCCLVNYLRNVLLCGKAHFAKTLKDSVGVFDEAIVVRNRGILYSFSAATLLELRVCYTARLGTHAILNVQLRDKHVGELDKLLFFLWLSHCSHNAPAFIGKKACCGFA